MTVHSTLLKLKELHYDQLAPKAREMVDTCLWGLDGMGELRDWEVRDYLTDKQIEYIKRIGERYFAKS